MEIKAGNVVKLKGSDIHMTVEIVYEAHLEKSDIKANVARLLWFVGDVLNSAIVSVDALEKVSD